MPRINSACFLAILLSALFWRFTPVIVYAEGPSDQIRLTIEAIQEVVRDPDFKGNAKTKEREKRVQSLISEQMDFEEMSVRSLGSNWRRISTKERGEFLELFPKYLSVFYRKQVLDIIEAMEKVHIEVAYPAERIDGEYARVDTIVGLQNDRIPVQYMLYLKNGSWKIYDINADNVSMINNWRSQFNRVIIKFGFDDLMKRLHEKVD